MVGAERNPIHITPQEWEAIDAGAISDTKIAEILRYTDKNEARALASGKTPSGLSDLGCDLADPDHPFAKGEKVIIHHMNPINIRDIREGSEFLMNPEYVVAVRQLTHNAIHYGDESLLMEFELVERRPNDMCPWK